ncbi:hypothetical protein sos41_37570 [Alphaproteobacteria bacterium SO-S41]|nr:hypothetical protein sos41_37570 [Alphaproteobacteria bacterium SO-S41]
MRLAAAFIAAALLAPAAFAGTERCSEPYGPVVPDGNTASAAEMRTAKAEVLQFIDDSDAYQACIEAVTKDPDEKMTPPQKQAAYKKMDDNQKEKVAVADAYNVALRAYKAKHGAAP